jgi:hypothetical protein
MLGYIRRRYRLPRTNLTGRPNPAHPRPKINTLGKTLTRGFCISVLAGRWCGPSARGRDRDLYHLRHGMAGGSHGGQAVFAKIGRFGGASCWMDTGGQSQAMHEGDMRVQV